MCGIFVSRQVCVNMLSKKKSIFASTYIYITVCVRAGVLISTIFADKPCNFFHISEFLLKATPLKAKALHNSVKVPALEYAVVCPQ